MLTFLHSCVKVLPGLLLLLLAQWGNSGLFGQSCDGNLGENIFADGDFGTGVANIVSPDPGIAPGFRYVLQGPPNDGAYTITNNTGAWAGLYPTWLAIRDNSPDPNGYMMVVNASFEPGLFYEQTIDGLCENTDYEFSADIINLIRANVQELHIKPNVTFLIDGEARFTSGEIAQTDRWITYAFSFSTAPGQTSVTLALRNNAPGGFGNDLGLDNISFRACGPLAQILPLAQEVTCQDGDPVELFATIEGDQFDSPAVQWQQSFDEGLTWQDIPGANDLTYLHTDVSSGYYYYRYFLSNGPVNLTNTKCRIISNEKIIFVQPKFYTLIDTLCQGLSITVGTSTYNATGTYLDSLRSTFGCDSIVTTELVIVQDTQIESELQLQDPSCSYATDGMISASLPVGGIPPFQYALDDLILVNGQSMLNLAPGSYLYRIEDRYGCTYEAQVSLVAPPEFTLDLGQDLSLELGDQTRINVQVSGGTTQAINWTPAEAVVCDPPCTEFALQPMNSIQLLAEAVNQNGCIATDSLLLEVVKVRKHFFPSAFSPNGDGVNDYFTGFGASPNVQLIEELLVADRWGNILFSKRNLVPNDQFAGWDGRAAGKELDEGIYVFTAGVRYFDGVVEQVSGEVTLVR